MKRIQFPLTVWKTAFTALAIAGVLTVFTTQAMAQFHFQESVKNRAVQKSRAVKNYKDREIIVKFKQGVAEQTIQAINKSNGTTVLAKHSERRSRRLRTDENKSIEDMLTVYRANPNVEYAEPNYTVTASMVPNDTYYPYQWNLDNEVSGGINMESAWDIQTGETQVIVAVLDTGVAYEDYGDYQVAPDLAQTNFVQGYDIINEDEHANDDNGHGTHVTGTIAQSTNNSIGAAGVAFNVTIMPVKVLDAEGSGTVEDVANGIYYAVDQGANIINLSLGSDSSSTTLKEACKYARQNAVTIVAAAGNDGADSISYPAGYDDYVIAVGATGYDEERTYYSNGGSSLDLMAPGGDLSVDLNGDGYNDGILQQTFSEDVTSFGYWFYSGTSMATPHVTGVAALLLSASSDLLPAQIQDILETTATDLGDEGWDKDTGWGLVDAAAALENISTSEHDVAVTAFDLPLEADAGQTVSLTLSLENQGTYDESVELVVSNTTTGTSITEETMDLESGESIEWTYAWDTSSLAAGEYTVTAALDPVSGETQTADNSICQTITINEAQAQAQIAINSITATGNGSQIIVNADFENTGSAGDTVTAHCVILNKTANRIVDDSLADQEMTLEAGDTKTLFWCLSANLNPGTYIAQVSLIEDPDVSSQTTFAVSSKKKRNDRKNNRNSRNNSGRNNRGNKR